MQERHSVEQLGPCAKNITSVKEELHVTEHLALSIVSYSISYLQCSILIFLVDASKVFVTCADD